MQALGRKLNEYWDAKMGHSNDEVQIQWVSLRRYVWLEG